MLKQLTVNCYQGTQITNVQQIYDWALKKRSVCYSVSGWAHDWIRPASWVISMQGRILCEMVSAGRLYHVVKKEYWDE